MSTLRPGAFKYYLGVWSHLRHTMYLPAQTLISVSQIQATKCLLILKALICRDRLLCFVILTTNITSRFDNSFCVSDTINSLLTLYGAVFVRIQQSVTSANNSLPVTGNWRHYRIYRPLSLDPILSLPNPVHISHPLYLGPMVYTTEQIHELQRN